MARPRSDDKRCAIISAAINVIAAEGLGAATATIAKQAGVSNGSLFTYFETKADLLNQVYVELKTEAAAAALNGLPTRSGIRKQAHYMWSHLLRWATSYPKKRRALVHLEVSDEITAESRKFGDNAFAGVADILEGSRKHGPMRKAPLGLIIGLMSALADATIDFMIRDPANADAHCTMAFDAFWRMVAYNGEKSKANPKI